MSNFWDMSDGTEIEDTNEFEMGGGNIEPIPDNTNCIATIEEATWKSYENDKYINVKWRVMRPEQYANRVIFQKVKVYGTSRDKDPQAAADKAKRMLAAIDQNCGGKLRQVRGEPTDVDLMTALVGRQMAIKVMKWEMTSDKDGSLMSGNWVAAVSPSKQQQAQTAPAAQAATDFDSEVPF